MQLYLWSRSITSLVEIRLSWTILIGGDTLYMTHHTQFLEGHRADYKPTGCQKMHPSKTPFLRGSKLSVALTGTKWTPDEVAPTYPYEQWSRFPGLSLVIHKYRFIFMVRLLTLRVLSLMAIIIDNIVGISPIYDGYYPLLFFRTNSYHTAHRRQLHNQD